VVPDQRLSKLDGISARIRQQLLDRFGIDHPILQFETEPCGQGGIFCEMSCGNGTARQFPATNRAPTSQSALGQADNKMKPEFRSSFFWARLALGLVFMYASIDKIYHPAEFAQIIFNYQILPDVLINITAIILPWLELLLGILLIAGIWLPGAIVLSELLLLTFFGTLVFNALRGISVHCGCFTTSAEGNPKTTWYLVRDGGFLLLGGYLFYRMYMQRSQNSAR
jgi:cobalt-zinc-cadmium efflux system protein